MDHTDAADDGQQPKQTKPRKSLYAELSPDALNPDAKAPALLPDRPAEKAIADAEYDEYDDVSQASRAPVFQRLGDMEGVALPPGYDVERGTGFDAPWWRSPVAMMVAGGVVLAGIVGAVLGSLNGDGAPLPVVSTAPTASPGDFVDSQFAPIVTPAPSIDQEAGVAWLTLSKADRPQFVIDQDIREPRARAMENWVWDYVDEAWSLEIFGNVERGAETGPEDPYQAMFLLAPDGEYVRLYTLRTDFNIRPLRFVPATRVVFLERDFYESFQTIAFNVQKGVTDEAWAVDATPALNRGVDGDQTWNVQFQGTLADGRDVWSGWVYGSGFSGVFFRNEYGDVTASANQAEFLKWGFDGTAACQAVDVNSGFAVHSVFENGEGDSAGPLRSFLHDLTTDTWREIAVDAADTGMCDSWATGWHMSVGEGYLKFETEQDEGSDAVTRIPFTYID